MSDQHGADMQRGGYLGNPNDKMRKDSPMYGVPGQMGSAPKQPHSSISNTSNVVSSNINAGNMPIGQGLYGSIPATEARNQDYGLTGLLPYLKQPSKEGGGPLAIGLDLTTLFPSISSPDPLFSSFGGPWSPAPIKRDPEFIIPSCYLVTPPPKITDKMDMFSDETLFFIFYTMPKDVMQINAARALLKREWVYHKELKLWFRRVPGADIVQNPNSEVGSYFCMDINRWEEVRKDGVVLEYDKLERNMH